MTALKRFIKWCIDNDLAFTNIDEAIRSFREDEDDISDGLKTLDKMATTDGTSALKTKYEVLYRRTLL